MRSSILVRHFHCSQHLCRPSQKPTNVVTTDEGVMVHTADPSTSGDGLGLVWGSVLWPSGIALAKYLCYTKHNIIPQSSSILELGCGTGIVGLTCAKFGRPAQLTLTDSESALWPLLRRSIEENRFDCPIEIHGLDWRDPTTFLMKHKYDLVVAADVLYSGMDKLFARALAAHLHTNTTIGLVASPYRTDSPLLGFWQASQRLGLQVERLENGMGEAVGAFTGVKAKEAYRGSQFVPLDSFQKVEEVSQEPTFSKHNEKQVQIFRVQRVSGTPEEAASIRRVNRIGSANWEVKA